MGVAGMHIRGDLPPGLAALLPVIANIHSGVCGPRSRNACIASSLVVRDALRLKGIDAEVAPVVAMGQSVRDGQRVWSWTVGRTLAAPDKPGTWKGHLVTIAQDHLIDTTCYDVAWEGPVGTFIVPLAKKLRPVVGGLRLLAGLNDERQGLVHQVVWLDDSTNDGWEQTFDARFKGRSAVVRSLLKTGARKVTV